MPAANWRMYPARTRNLWLATSASAGASRRVGINSWDQRCIVSCSCEWRIEYCSSRLEDDPGGGDLRESRRAGCRNRQPGDLARAGIKGAAREERASESGASVSSEFSQDLLSQLLRLAKELLVFGEQAVQFQRLFRLQPVPQDHIAKADGVGQQGFLVQFFESSMGIIVIHGVPSPDFIVAPARSLHRARPFRFPTGHAGARPPPACDPHPPPPAT